MKKNVKSYLKKFPNFYIIVQRIFYILVLIPKSKLYKSFIIVAKSIFVKLPIKNNKIVICNFHGNGYGCHPKYIAEELLRQNNDYDIVWLLRKGLFRKTEIPNGIRIVEYKSIKHLYELATAKIWIDNERKFIYTPKRKKQFYIQTMHGVVALKQCDKDVEKQLTPFYIKAAKNDSKMIDLFLSNSKFNTNLFRRAYWYDGEILEVGAPRCEVQIKKSEDIERKVRQYLNIDSDKHILLYAPTWRESSTTEVYNIDFDNLIKTLEKRFGEEWIVLVRLHPQLSTKMAGFVEYNSRILNATEYDDVNELLSVSEIFITDYSSTMFDFSLTKKPIFLYAADIEAYIDERNFYFDIYSLPYPLAEDNKQLQRLIENYDKDKYLSELNNFHKKIGIFDPKGGSAKIVEVINSQMELSKSRANGVKRHQEKIV